jgi:lipoprotein LprG
VLRRHTTVFVFVTVFMTLLAAVGLVGGCDTAQDTSGLPDGAQLVSAAAASFDELHTVRFDFDISGAIPGLDVRGGVGQVSRDGSASGKADVEGHQTTFTINGSLLYLTDQHGNRTERPVPAGYTPAALLDRSRGLTRLLRGATGLKTETKEDIQGVQAYRVTGELTGDVVSSVLRQIRSDVVVKFWVTQNEPQELVRVWMQVPPQRPNEGAVMLELALAAAS